MSPLLHCETGVRNVIFELLRDLINEHNEIYVPEKESILMQMMNMGDKMEDWVERLHLWEMQQRRHSCTVHNPIVCALAQEKAGSCKTHPDVFAQVDATDKR